ncbi:putative ribosome-binding factor A, mitochondrial isoform X1 [Melanerpes formicivorus]|uniref:putative ribosome-binding factor A, mitochondrial isoform X1 n=1 Tax=Melanerpes formicivorus TaxID=211600 RepID=UPI00358FB069
MWRWPAAALPRWARALRSSAALGGSRNLLKKMLRKKKKKLWYDSPTLGSRMMLKPSEVASVLQGEQRRARKEDSIRYRVLNSLIHKALADMMTTCEISQELYDLQLDICKVSLASNFSACRIYWNPAATTQKESYVERVLQRSAPRIRYLLTSRQIVGNMPPVVFVKDREGAAVREVEELLSVADFGPPEEEALPQEDSRGLLSSAAQPAEPPLRPSLFGVDHAALHKQIMDYKRLKVSREAGGSAWTEEQKQQLSRVQKQRRKQPSGEPDDDLTPQQYLRGRQEAEHCKDTELAADWELEDDLQEEAEELGKALGQPADKLP